MKLKPFIFIVIFFAIAGITTYTLLAGNKSEPSAKPKTTHIQEDSPAKIEFNKKQYSLDDPTSIWVVVNKVRPLQPKAYVPSDLTTVGNGQQLRKSAADAFMHMQSDAKADGQLIEPLSGYRSYETQVRVYNNEVSTFGQAKADEESARPGYSEHQTGLGIDIGGGGCGIEDCFGATPAGKWVAANAYKYGFIQRYTPDKISITGYRHEAWHYRFIGIELATQMHDEGVETLEEFFGLPAAPTY